MSQEYSTKLQLALDQSVESGLAALASVHSFVDIIEVGTPLIFQEGMQGVHAFREAYPNHQVLADLKIMDAGEREAEIAFEAGAQVFCVSDSLVARLRIFHR